MKRVSILLGIVSTVFIFTFANTHAQTFSDGTFNPSDWTASKISDTSAGQVGTFSVMQPATGGNPGSFRAVNTTATQVHDIMEIANLYNAVYTPGTLGPLQSISFSWDAESFSDAYWGWTTYALLYQGGMYYRSANYYSPNVHAWGTLSMSGTASDFVDVTTQTTHPDFSANGGAIEFGYLIKADTYYAQSALIDNWSVQVVPEPASYLLMSSGLLGLLVWRALRKKM